MGLILELGHANSPVETVVRLLKNQTSIQCNFCDVCHYNKSQASGQDIHQIMTEYKSYT